MALPPYDIVMTVLNAAKTRLGDAVETLAPIGGKLLDNTQPFTQQICNDAWRKMQEYLAELGYSGLKQEAFFGNVPACTTTDPTVQVSIGYNGYFDGTTLQVAPVLPQNMIRPYDLWERIYQAGTNNAAMFETDYILNGLPSIPKGLWNRQWEWRNDTIYMPGATDATDIRIRYGGYLLDFVDVGGSAGPNQTANAPWFQQPVPIMRCIDSLADFICREVEISRGEADKAALFEASAKMNARLILNRDTSQPKAVLKASELGKMGDRYTPTRNADTDLEGRRTT